MELHSIREDKRVAFRARLKHLQRLGFPPGINTGTGRAADYGGSQIFLIGLALEMLQLGLTPDRAVDVIRRNSFPICTGARMALTGLNREDDEIWPAFLQFDPEALSGLAKENSGDGPDNTFWYSGTGSLAEYIKEMGTLLPRLAVLNLSSLISHVFTLIHTNEGEESANKFEAELTEWLASYPEDLDGDT